MLAVQMVMMLEGTAGSWQLSVVLPPSPKSLCFGGKGLKWEEGRSTGSPDQLLGVRTVDCNPGAVSKM